jgi:hypothetical protein
MTQLSIQLLLSLALGFAIAGMCSSAYRVATAKLPSFSVLSTGPRPEVFAAVPLLVISAPFLIMRNTILNSRHEGGRFEFVFVATIVAGFWSLMSGLVLITTLQACGFLVA